MTFRRPQPSEKVASKHRNSECLRQNHNEQQTTSIMSHEKHIVNATGCSDSLTVFNTDSTYTYVKESKAKNTMEPESATDAARSASSKHYYTQKLLATEAVTHRSFYTPTLRQTRLHANAFTHRHFYTQTLFTHRHFCTNNFTHRFYTQKHRHFYTQTLLHTDAFTHKPHRRLYAQSRLHTDAFTHGRFYTQTLLHTNTLTHRHFYTQTLLHANAFTHSRVYTQTLLHTDAFTHKHFVSQTLLHTKAFTHKHFDTQKLLHTKAFTHRRLHTDSYTQTLAHTCSETSCRITDVECIARAKTLQLNLTGNGEWLWRRILSTSLLDATVASDEVE